MNKPLRVAGSAGLESAPAPLPADRVLPVLDPPPPVGPGARIRVISPGLPTLMHVPERGERARDALRALGFRVGFSRHAHGLSPDGIASGTVEERAADLMEAFADDTVDGIMISDSGGGTLAMLPLLDAGVIMANPKPFVGFCDTVFLNQYLADLGLASYAGSCLMFHLGDVGGPFPETADHLVRALAVTQPLMCGPVGDRAKPLESWHIPEQEGARRVRTYPGGWTWLRTGIATGPLYGGELSLLPQIVDRFGVSFDGAMLWWDVTEVQPEPVDAMMAALAARTDLSRLAGMVVGANSRMAPDDWVRAVAAALDRHVPGYDYPVLANADICHMVPSWTLPYGEIATLDSGRGLILPRTKAER